MKFGKLLFVFAVDMPKPASARNPKRTFRCCFEFPGMAMSMFATPPTPTRTETKAVGAMRLVRFSPAEFLSAVPQQNRSSFQNRSSLQKLLVIDFIFTKILYKIH